MIHVDHALRNVLLDKSGTAKLTDFGMSMLLRDGDTYRNLSSVCFRKYWGYSVPVHIVRKVHIKIVNLRGLEEIGHVNFLIWKIRKKTLFEM